VERKRYDGRKFLLCAEEICAKIDRLRSQIDRVYQKIEHQKQVLVGGLGLGVASLVNQEEVPKDALLKQVHRRFFVLLEEVKRLKEQRRREYKRLKGLKKSWFGYVSNEEIRLLQKYEGALVREDLTVVALKKGEERYKGRTFNKMLNNGAMGQYKRMAGQKLLWNGIAQQVLPSYWTSSTCVKCGVVDKKMRCGERFECERCGDVRHADENAADTLACYLFLVPS
jgi:transposase